MNSSYIPHAMQAYKQVAGALYQLLLMIDGLRDVSKFSRLINLKIIECVGSLSLPHETVRSNYQTHTDKKNTM